MNETGVVPSRRVLLIHGDVYGLGGAENHCVRVAESLQQLGYQVTVLHAGGSLDSDLIRSWSGIALDPLDVTFKTAWPFYIWPRLFSGLVLMRYAIVLRAARKIAKRYDLVVGTYGEVPLRAKNLVQSTHVPLFFYDSKSLSYLGFDAGKSRFRHLVRIVYVIAARRIAGWNRSCVESAALLVNSKWTARQFLNCYPKSQPLVIYHGAVTKLDVADHRYLAFHQRSNNFVILGRVVPAKRVELAIELVDALRREGHDVGLLIIGNGSGSYAETISDLVFQRDYVSWVTNLSREEVECTVASQKWGLHCAADEHYGLAAIEMLRLGCIVFVPDSGGQVEVIDDVRLRYSNLAEALVKISAVLGSSALQKRLLSVLSDIAQRHTVERFRRELQAFVTTYRSVR